MVHTLSVELYVVCICVQFHLVPCSDMQSAIRLHTAPPHPALLQSMNAQDLSTHASVSVFVCLNVHLNLRSPQRVPQLRSLPGAAATREQLSRDDRMRHADMTTRAGGFWLLL